MDAAARLQKIESTEDALMQAMVNLSGNWTQDRAAMLHSISGALKALQQVKRTNAVIESSHSSS